MASAWQLPLLLLASASLATAASINSKPRMKFSCGFKDSEVWPGSLERGSHLVEEGYSWAKEKGRMPYKFDNSVSAGDRKAVQEQMKVMEGKTCIRFVETANPPKHYLRITVEGQSCQDGGGGVAFSAHVSQEEGGNLVFKSQYTLAGCGMAGGILHELFHTLGVMHTQMRPDRDDYITVNFNNIQDKSQYEKCKACKPYGVPFDCESIMMYGTATMSNGNGPTMRAKNPATCKLSEQGPSKPTGNDWKLMKIIADGSCKASGSATSAPATSAPVTSAPVTSAPATSAPATSAPATSAPATSGPNGPDGGDGGDGGNYYYYNYNYGY